MEPRLGPREDDVQRILDKFIHQAITPATEYNLKQQLSQLFNQYPSPRKQVAVAPGNNHSLDVYVGRYDEPGCPAWAYEQLAPRIVRVRTPVIGRNFEIRIETSNHITYLVFHGKNSRYSHDLAQCYRNRIGLIFTEQDAHRAQDRHKVEQSIKDREKLRRGE